LKTQTRRSLQSCVASGSKTKSPRLGFLYKDVETMVRDMTTTLPLVNELHSPAMRPRHWKELASVCGVKALDPTDSKFCLEDLIELKLHTHAEEVSEIVDNANKEAKIEKKMDEIEAAWRTSQP